MIYAGWLGGYGNLVVVDHGSGLSTAYAHNSASPSASGRRSRRADVIAYSGNTGNSTGPHVHFEVRVNGAPSIRSATCRGRGSARPGRRRSVARYAASVAAAGQLGRRRRRAGRAGAPALVEAEAVAANSSSGTVKPT